MNDTGCPAQGRFPDGTMPLCYPLCADARLQGQWRLCTGTEFDPLIHAREAQEAVDRAIAKQVALSGRPSVLEGKIR